MMKNIEKELWNIGMKVILLRKRKKPLESQ